MKEITLDHKVGTWWSQDLNAGPWGVIAPVLNQNLIPSQRMSSPWEETSLNAMILHSVPAHRKVHLHQECSEISSAPTQTLLRAHLIPPPSPDLFPYLSTQVGGNQGLTGYPLQQSAQGFACGRQLQSSGTPLPGPGLKEQDSSSAFLLAGRVAWDAVTSSVKKKKKEKKNKSYSSHRFVIKIKWATVYKSAL